MSKLASDPLETSRILLNKLIKFYPLIIEINEYHVMQILYPLSSDTLP